MNESTVKLLHTAEQLSGRPVRVREDPSLKTLATIQMARGNAPMHMISYRPVPGIQPDYHIAFQCGFIVRLFQNPPDSRFDFVPAPDDGAKMEKLIADPTLRAAKDMLLGGILTQLRSVPIGMRIDDWLWSDYPKLRDEQIASARRQLNDNVQGLSPNVRKMFPKRIVAGNTAMNAAYAMFWAAKMDEPAVALPYRSIAADIDGKALLRIYQKVDSNPKMDWTLVDQWAEHLGFLGWYRWMPYKLEI